MENQTVYKLAEYLTVKWKETMILKLHLETASLQ